MRVACGSVVLLANAVWLAAPASAEQAGPGGQWWERLSPKGDFRLRHERIYEEPGADRDRERYRGRFGISARPTDGVEFGLRIATGNGDPASANLNFGDSFAASDVRIDRAYLAWSAAEGLDLIAGEMANPFFRAGDTALMWDSDVDPRGLAGKFQAGAVFGRAGGFLLNYRENSVESRVYGAQAGVELEVAGAALTTGVGWFDFTDTAGHTPLYGDDPQGNSVDLQGLYINDYDIAQVFAEYEFAIGNWPLVAFAEWTRNTRAALADTAYAFGASVGKAEEAGTAELSWEWRDTEADALVAIFTDSNLGDGRTDSSGHVLKGSYMLTDHVGFGATLIFSEYGEFAGTPTDFDRVMLDVEFSF